jgi:tellurite resistance protein TerC
MKVFRFLHTGLALILILVGLKMIVAHYFKVPTLAMLGVVAGILTASVVGSILIPEKEWA